MKSRISWSAASRPRRRGRDSARERRSIVHPRAAHAADALDRRFAAGSTLRGALSADSGSLPLAHSSMDSDAQRAAAP
jgi:hypothetical protein